MVRVAETNLEQINERLKEMRTNLNKINYLESVFKSDPSISIKRVILGSLASLYEEDRMYERAAKAMSNKARFEVIFKDKIAAYVKSAELFCKTGSIEDAEEMFNRAFREANETERTNLIMIRKEMYLRNGEYLERSGKRSGSVKFYEKLMSMRLDAREKDIVKERLSRIYKSLGKFKEAEMVSKM